MRKRANEKNFELEHLIREQAADRSAKYVYAEKIARKRQIIFSGLTDRQKACLMLSFAMSQRKIANLLNINLGAVKRRIRVGLLNLSRDQRTHFQRIRRECRRMFE